MEQNQCVLVRRDNREKQFVSLDNLEEAIESSLTALHDAIYQRALDNLKEKTFTATTYEEFLDTAQTHPGFIKAMWCGDSACEDKIKAVSYTHLDVYKRQGYGCRQKWKCVSSHPRSRTWALPPNVVKSRKKPG